MQINNGWRVASVEEITALQAKDGAPHVVFGCTCCGMVNWSAKNLALANDGRYNGMRRIFVLDWNVGECSCASSSLRCVVEVAQ